MSIIGTVTASLILIIEKRIFALAQVSSMSNYKVFWKRFGIDQQINWRNLEIASNTNTCVFGNAKDRIKAGEDN